MKFNIDTYEMDSGNIKQPKKFINRDLSWVDFNYRVLSCACKKEIPINERFNFIGITESNLDEFISVRFAGAYSEKESNNLYNKLLKKIKRFKNDQNAALSSLKKELNKVYGYTFVKPSDLNKDEKEILKRYYYNEIFPKISPLNISDNDINLLSGLSYLSAIVSRGNYENIVIIPIKDFNPFFIINKKIILIDEIIKYYLKDSIFINQNIESIGIFKVIKDGSVILSHDTSKFIVDRMKDTINARNTSDIIFIEFDSSCDERMKSSLISLFKVPNNHTAVNIVGDIKIFSKGSLVPNCNYKEFTPFNYDNNKNYYDIFEALDNEDILLHHPYDAYDTVVKFIEHASVDKYVNSIKMTLYRVSSIDSPIVNALCNASMNGKFVVVLVEIKARFDENNNIKVLNKLKNAGVNVILGNEFLKTHCKMCLITRSKDNHVKIYSHVATGNYNEKTAKLYTDISYMTGKTKIGRDLLNVFNILAGHSSPDDDLSKVFYAPVNLRKRLIKCIDREIEYAKKGKKAEIFIKVNSLSDELMVNKLYEAADKGVDIYIVCRGICSVVPRKHLYVKSIVGRFLEHSRIYYFKNDNKPEYYISSADLLTRNLDRRVETLINITDSKIMKQLKWMILVFKRDETNSYVENEKGEWTPLKGDFDSHQWMINYSDIKKKKKKW